MTTKAWLLLHFGHDSSRRCAPDLLKQSRIVLKLAGRLHELRDQIAGTAKHSVLVHSCMPYQHAASADYSVKTAVKDWYASC